ncbi:non-ribosomal peptide synthetase [Streptomyces bambusae]|uniref:Amino acid adenylation domain-containing protein n=1 Tax=Streptomyces bambusae TaxID=1550616 RepID=A0ABS6ZFS1_9ACTN|nr:non-ribosomal peptide synthetase [Streptomyces bambusae]MBW5486593.1 amino acid adenylation domain-containing protein [Streptomyces bambusae]
MTHLQPLPRRYRRPVSPTERLYLAAGDPRGAMALRIVVEGDGVPDRSHLEAALAQAAHACPGSRLVRVGSEWIGDGPLPRLHYAAPATPAIGLRAGGAADGRGPASPVGPAAPEPRPPAPADGTGRAPGGPVGAGDAWPPAEGSAGPGASAPDAVSVPGGATCFARSVALPEGIVPAGLVGAGRWPRTDRPGCDVLVVPGAAGALSTLVFSASHALMDGHGALVWVREVFRALRGEPARPAYGQDTDHGLLSGLAPGRRRPAPLPDQRSPLGRFGPGPERTLWLRRTLPGHHPALTARLAQALTDSVGRGTRVMVPVDLRRHRSGPPATGNLTLPLFLDLAPGRDWAAGHAELLAALAEGRELAAGFEAGLAPLPLPATGLLLRAAQAATRRADRHLASAVVSHLGRIAPADCSGGGFRASTVYALPVHAPLVPVSLVAAETDTATEITLGVRGGPGLSIRAARLLDTALGHLTAAGPAPTRSAPPPPAPKPASERVQAGPAPSAPAPAQDAPPDADADAATPSEPRTVVALFRAQAARTPQALALDGPDGPVTYAELDARSDAVAAELRRRGIGREDLVGLVVDRTPAGVGALWGILKAGAAYVPLDPDHPAPRTKEILHDAGVRLCLTQHHLLNRLDGAVPCPLLAVEDLPSAPAGKAIAPDPAPEDLAYVIHTSGSTGRPKGVQIEHRSLLGFVRWATDLCRVGPGTRFGFVNSYAFDISCFPLFLPLLAGGTAVLAPGPVSRATLRGLVAEHRADTLALTPSHLALTTGPTDPTSSTGPMGTSGTLLLGGEALTPAAVRAARAAFGPHARIVNAYGPTEATVACLAHVVDDGPGAEPAAPTVPIGTPGPYADVELLAEDGAVIGDGPQDVGRTGEIVVSGLQVARGYLGRSDDDGARPSPFTVRPDGTRAYRTGDLGRRLPGGAVEFAGRIDGQLKIAGHRVEPAETVAALESHPGVARAVVVPRRRPGAAAHPVLCAYVVPRTTADEDLPATLRTNLARVLPAHLVPAHLIVVDAVPSTVSGKADPDALPDPFTRDGPVAAAPASLEERVAHHWAAVLGADPAELTPDADFQALGGDSLALVEMLTAVSADLLDPDQGRLFMAGLECLVREMTLGQVCERVRAARAEAVA